MDKTSEFPLSKVIWSMKGGVGPFISPRKPHNLWGRDRWCIHLSDRKTEAESREVTCPRVTQPGSIGQNVSTAVWPYSEPGATAHFMSPHVCAAPIRAPLAQGRRGHPE